MSDLERKSMVLNQAQNYYDDHKKLAQLQYGAEYSTNAVEGRIIGAKFEELSGRYDHETTKRRLAFLATDLETKEDKAALAASAVEMQIARARTFANQNLDILIEAALSESVEL